MVGGEGWPSAHLYGAFRCECETCTRCGSNPRSGPLFAHRKLVASARTRAREITLFRGGPSGRVARSLEDSQGEVAASSGEKSTIRNLP